MSRKRSVLTIAVAGAALVACHFAGIARVAGEKIDSGLGSLPPYNQWQSDSRLSRFVVATVPSEKIDSGLGAMPHYSQWKHYPELSRMAAAEGGSAPTHVASVSR